MWTDFNVAFTLHMNKLSDDRTMSKQQYNSVYSK
jgi:hypothetical protein